MEFDYIIDEIDSGGDLKTLIPGAVVDNVGKLSKEAKKRAKQTFEKGKRGIQNANTKARETVKNLEREIKGNVARGKKTLERVANKTKESVNKTRDKVASTIKRQGVSVIKAKKSVQHTLDKARARNQMRIDEFQRTAKHITSRWKDRLENAPVVRLRDKIAFTVAVVLMLVIEWVLLVKPGSMPALYCVLIIPLLVLRFVLYHDIKFHYFMLDFCYFAQVLLLWTIGFYPNSATLLKLNFTVANGPLITAIVAWNNSLVFHDIDKITSVAIHVLPALTTYAQRWYPNSSFNCFDQNCSISLFDTFVTPMIVYLLWQVSYLCKTEVHDQKKLEHDKEVQTSLRWFISHPKGWPYRLGKRLGAVEEPWRWIYIMVGFQFIYTLATMTPVYLCYNSFAFHTTYLCLICVVSIWNGANFYFEKFSEIYIKRIGAINTRMAAQIKEQSNLASADVVDVDDVLSSTSSHRSQPSSETTASTGGSEPAPLLTETDSLPTEGTGASKKGKKNNKRRGRKKGKNAGGQEDALSDADLARGFQVQKRK